MMSLQYTIYRSTDTDAPVMSGQNSALINVLLSVVNGYGAKSGVTWTEPFSGVNKAVLRNGNTSTHLYLAIDDSGPGAGGAKEARVRGNEVMTGIGAADLTETNPFPTAAQAANGQFVRKSASADAVARPWVMFATSRALVLFIWNGDATGASMLFFGDIIDFAGNDSYSCGICGRPNENTGGNDSWSQFSWAGLYMARTQGGGAGAVAATRSAGTGAGSYVGQGSYSPYALENRILSRINVEHNTGVRGYLPGLWAPMQNVSVAPAYQWYRGKTFSLTMQGRNRTFELVDIALSGSTSFVAVETSATLDYL